jgi:hypothetical protein
MKNPRLALAAFLTLASTAANAADLSQPNVGAPLPDPAILPGSLVPNSAFFLGLSASANWTRLCGRVRCLTCGTLAKIQIYEIISYSRNSHL